jgi:hypothetical protein
MMTVGASRGHTDLHGGRPAIYAGVTVWQLDACETHGLAVALAALATQSLITSGANSNHSRPIPSAVRRTTYAEIRGLPLRIAETRSSPTYTWLKSGGRKTVRTNAPLRLASSMRPPNGAVEPTSNRMDRFKAKRLPHRCSTIVLRLLRVTLILTLLAQACNPDKRVPRVARHPVFTRACRTFRVGYVETTMRSREIPRLIAMRRMWHRKRLRNSQ